MALKILIEDIIKYQQFKESINNTPLEDIEFIENFQTIKVSPEVIKEWEYVGLSNIDFILSRCYKDPDFFKPTE
jgi:predicted ATP-grasp superfamily ATP-dependent carboligase